MTKLLIGLVLFFAVHFVPAMTGVKQSLRDRFGANGYRGAFSLVSLAGFALIIWGYATAETSHVYAPPVWGRHVTMALVLLAFVCLAAANMRGNIRKTLRHPMLIGVALWGIGHLLANGDLVSVLLFGSFVAYAILDMVIATSQGRVAEFEVKPANDIVAVLAGVVAYAIFLFLHPYVIGVAVV